MSTKDDLGQQMTDATRTRQTSIVDALDKLRPNTRHEQEALFAALYPAIKKHLARNVSRKAILEVLRQGGLKLHPARFKQLLDAHELQDGKVEGES